MSKCVLELDSLFDSCGRTGANFSRINRDIRFAKDKTPYRPQMYLRFTATAAGGRESGQLYAGIFADTATAGYAIYAGPKRKEYALALIAEPRVHANPKWLPQPKKRQRPPPPQASDPRRKRAGAETSATHTTH